MFLQQVWTIAAKDLHSELRTKEAWNASIAFTVVILLLFSFAFDPSSEQIREFSGGLLWMTYAFAGALVLNRSFARELQNDCLDALIASPISSAALFTGKAFANFSLVHGFIAPGGSPGGVADPADGTAGRNVAGPLRK